MRDEAGNIDSVQNDAGRQRRIIFSIAFVSFMVSVDTYVVNISLPTIAKNFGVNTGDVSWVVLAYLIAVTSSLLIFGKLGDRIGLKRVFISGFVIFTGASLLCGVSSSLGMLIFSRFLQGIGGSMLLGMAPAMIPRLLPGGLRGSAFGYYATAAALGITLGTPLGGIITGYFSWHWIFLINVPTGIWAIWYSNGAIPGDTARGRGDDSFDYFGAVLLVLCLSLLVYALNTGGEAGWTSPVIIASFLSGSLLLAFFIYWERRARPPLLDLTLFDDREFTLGNLASCFAVSVQAGSNFLLPFYLERLKKLPPQQAGMVILVYSIVYMAGSIFFGKMSDRVKPRTLCAWGMALGTAAAVFFALTLDRPGLFSVVVFLGVIAIAYAMFIPSNNNLVMGMASQGKLGTVSGLFRMGIYVSLVAGVCIFETLFSAYTGGSTAGGMVEGFRNSYLLGGLFCFLSVAFSLASMRGEAGRKS
jgi:EmrB/QacA subfamily drug resistance transporter